MKRLYLIICMLLFFIETKAQRELSVQFASNESVPAITYLKNSFSINFKTDKTLENIFLKYKIIKFEKKFPTVEFVKHSKAAALNRVYLIGIKEENIQNLYDELLKYSGRQISEVFIQEPFIPLATPNDFSSNFTFCGGASSTGSGLDLINAREAWDITEGSSSITIGITDVGFDSSHQDLRNKILAGPTYTYLTSSGWGSHGLEVAGFAACETNNNIGFASIGNKSTVKFFDLSINAILLAAQNNCRVVNCSWLSSCTYIQSDQDLIDLVDSVYHTVIVAGAGNGVRSTHCGGSSNGNGLAYPASYNHVISVTAVGQMFDQGQPAYNCNGSIPTLGFSRRDYHDQYSNSRYDNPFVLQWTYTHNDSIDLCAPGYAVPILVTGNNYSSYGGYGTSFSSPMVAGTAALVLAVNPSLYPKDVEAILKCTARDLYEIPQNFFYLNLLGAGRIDAGKAVKLAQTWTPNTGGSPLAPPSDIRWFDILSNDSVTVEEEVTCKTVSNTDKCNIGYRLETVGGSTQKWLIYYSEHDSIISGSVKYGSSVILTRGIDYPITNSATGKISVAVRTNDCVPGRYYLEEKTADCFDSTCTHSCLSDITITGTYSKAITESSTWIKSSGQTTIDNASSVKLDAEPTGGYVEMAPSSSSDYFIAAPSTDIAVFSAQALDGCDSGVVARHAVTQQKPPKNNEAEITGVSVFPNPAKGSFNIICSKEYRNAVFQLYSINGKQQNVFIKTNGAKSTQVDCPHLSGGVYLLKISGAGKTEIRKIVLL